MADLIVRLLAMYDRVIFDTPPVLAATDAVVLSTQVDATVMVIKAGASHRQAVLRSLGALKSVHARLLGGILNMVNADEHGGYYYYYLYGENAKKKTSGRKSKGSHEKVANSSKKS
jgi:Mrp family chromosome partitioning ATPase